MVFLVATFALMVSAIMMMAIEVRSSHVSVNYEAMRVIGLTCAWEGTNR